MPPGQAIKIEQRSGVDEIADPANPHQERPRNNQSVSQDQERRPVQAGEERGAGCDAEHHTMGGHSPKPIGGNQSEMLTIKRPFVERDLDEAAAGQPTDHDEQAQAPDLPERQGQIHVTAPKKEVNLQEPKGKAEPVPPEVHPADVSKHRVDVMDVRSDHDVP